MMNSINNLNNPNMGYATAASAQAQNYPQADGPESFAAGIVRAEQELDNLLIQCRLIASTLLGDSPADAKQGNPQPVPNGVFDALQMLGGRMNLKIGEAQTLLNRIQNKLT